MFPITRSGFAAVIGLPNAGKSTLINALMKDQLLITSEKHQTTRKHVKCILTGDDYQIVLVDTPGLHQPKNKLGEFMISEVHNVVENCDVVLYLLDVGKPEPNLLDDYTGNKPVVLVLNKIDTIPAQRLEELKERFEADPRFIKVIAASALMGRFLDEIIQGLVEFLPQGPYLYPEDQLMDTDYRFLASELIREQTLLLLEDEVPHGIAVDIDNFSETDEDATISATILVERESHKGIVIGRKGSMLGTIGKNSRFAIQRLMGKPVHLKLWVKVRKNWRKDANQLKWLGYK